MNSILQVQQSLLSQMDHTRAIQQDFVSQQQSLIRPALEFYKDSSSTISGTFNETLQAIDAQQHKASNMMAAVDSGKSEDLVGTMIESQKASLAFSALVQVRNKVTGAFEEIMRLQM